MNSELDVKAIRERVEKATPGPWEAEIDHENHQYNVNIPATHPRSIALSEHFGEFPPGENNIVFTTCYDLPEDPSNIEFIAHARTDIPLLLSALSSSEGLVRELAEAIRDYTTVGMLMDPTFPAKYERLKEVINTDSVRRILEGK
jgi:hypothetical protein